MQIETESCPGAPSDHFSFVNLPFEFCIFLTSRRSPMPTDETRRVLKVFGVAVTAFEDAVDKGAAPEELRKAEAEVKTRLDEITVLIEQLRVRKK